MGGGELSVIMLNIIKIPSHLKRKPLVRYYMVPTKNTTYILYTLCTLR